MAAAWSSRWWSRNKLIYALSNVTLAVAADKGAGGTW